MTARRVLLNGLICICSFGIAVVLGRVLVLEDLERRSVDLRFRLRGEIPIAEELVLIEIDNPTVSHYGEYPIPRGQIALLLNNLADAGARSIAIDIPFEGTDPSSPWNDTLLWDISATSQVLTHAVDIPFSAPTAESSDDWRIEQLRHSCRAQQELGLSDLYVGDPTAAGWPMEDLWESGHAFGGIGLLPDPDGTVRATPILVRTGAQVMPALSLEALRIWYGAPKCGYAWRNDHLEFAGHRGRVSLPVSERGVVRVNYPGKYERFPRHSFIDALQTFSYGDSASQHLANSVFAGRLVLIGVTSTLAEYQDRSPTPYSHSEPQLATHASIISSGLTGSFLVPQGRTEYALVLTVLVFIAVLAIARPRILERVLLLGALMIAVATLSAVMFVVYGVLMATVVPLVGCLLVGVAHFTVEYLKEQSERRQLAAERLAAAEIQKGLLPSGPIAVDGYDIGATYVPSRDVSGDYYDVFPVENDLALVVADVSGKGVGAALIMASLRGLFRSELERDDDLARAVNSVNRHLCAELTSGKFVTGFFALLTPKSGALRCVNAGHNPPMVIHESGDSYALDECDLILGVDRSIDYSEHEILLGDGDLLALFTDGIGDTLSRRGLQYTDSRLIDLIKRERARSAEAIVDSVLHSVTEFAAGRPFIDDLTMLIVKRAHS